MDIGEFRSFEAMLQGDDVLDLAALVDRPGWMADALCREPAYRAVTWFPERGESLEPALAVCSRCLVRVECREYAASLPVTADHGVWGGTSSVERRRMRRDAA